MKEPLLLAGREEQLRREVSGVRRPQLTRLLEECERYRDQVLPAEPPHASITYFGSAAANLALAYRITRQEQYLTELRRWLAPPVSFAHWGRAHMPDHDLDAAWLLHGLSLAYAWAGPALPLAERSALREKLILQGTRMYDFAVAGEGGWWSSSYWQNHNWICYAGLATAGYVLADEHPAAVAWTKRAKDNFEIVLDLLNEDGSNDEGVVYWRYGVPWLVSYLDVLKAAEGVDWFPRSAYLRETFWYRLYQAAPDLERIVDHGDCHDRRSGHCVAMYYKLAAEYRIPQAQWLGNKVAKDFFWREAYESGVRPGVRPEAYQELLWFDPSAPVEGLDNLPTSRFFPDLGLMVARTSWGEDATLVSFKAAPGGGHKAWDTSHRIESERGWITLNAGHHHPDSGSFVMLGAGSYLAVDEGYSSRKHTAHHNGVLVDGHGFDNEDRYHIFEGLGAERTAQIVTTTLGGGWTHAVSEISRMYDPALGVDRIRRHLVMSPAGTVVVVDDLAADVPRRWTWLLQTDNPAVAVGAGRWAAPAGSGQLWVTALAPASTQDDVVPTPVQANPTSSTPGLEIEKVQYTLRRETSPTREAGFVTVLEPADWDDHGGSQAHAEATGREVLVIIERDGRREEVALHLDGADIALPGAEITGTGFAARTTHVTTVG
jgi:hypothetical protein